MILSCARLQTNLEFWVEYTRATLLARLKRGALRVRAALCSDTSRHVHGHALSVISRDFPGQYLL